MGNQIISKPDAIRAAGSNISGLDTKTASSSFPTDPSSSKGLVAEGIIEIIDEIEAIETLIAGIIQKFPGKLDKVASLIEEYDNVAANQFK